MTLSTPLRIPLTRDTIATAIICDTIHDLDSASRDDLIEYFDQFNDDQTDFTDFIIFESRHIESIINPLMLDIDSRDDEFRTILDTEYDYIFALLLTALNDAFHALLNPSLEIN